MTANSKAVSARLEPSRSGQRAHDLRLGPQPEYVDETRSHLNRTIIEPLASAALRDEWQEVKDRIGKTGKIRSNQNLSYAGIITFGHEAQKIFERLPKERQDAAFLEVGQKIAERFNTRLTGMVFHGDETAPHAHFQLRGIAENGTMLSQVVKRAALREVQDITARVMASHADGIERGKEKWVRIEEGEDFASTVNRSVQQLHEDLPAEIAAKEAKLAEVTAKLDTNRERLTKAEVDLARAIEQIGAESAKAEKIRKRAATYEARATKAQAEADRLATELAEIEGRVAEAEKRAQEAQERAQVAEGRAEALDAAVAPLRDAVAAYDAYEAAEAARISAIETDDLQQQAENEVAARLFTQHVEATSLAILFTDPDWDFSKLLASTPLDPKLPFPDMRQALIENSELVRSLEYRIEGSSAGEENAEVDIDLSDLGRRLRQNGGDVRPLKREPAWQRLFGDPASVLRKFFYAMVQKIVGERLAELRKPAPMPASARPAAAWPEDLRDQIRATKGSDPTP